MMSGRTPDWDTVVELGGTGHEFAPRARKKKKKKQWSDRGIVPVLLGR